MAPNMAMIVRQVFPRATQVIDRFHVQKLAIEALQDMRVQHRWKAIELENNEIELARQEGQTHISLVFENGDTRKQLLARSRYLLFKSQDKWTCSQIQRAEILFEHYPDLEQAYKLTHKLRLIYSKTKDKMVAYTKLAQWYEEVEKTKFKTFNTVIKSLYGNYRSILNFFDNRSTNASAESFNAKIKAFRANLKGVNSIPYFLFRIVKIFA